jgi:membrane associated rhomboid family serine protease
MMEQLNTSLALIVNQTQANLIDLGIILMVIWSVFFINTLLGNHLFIFGISPRRLYGLPGILLCPLLHANFNHIFFNSIPLLVLSNFILIHGVDYFLEVTLLITLGSGFLVWCFAKPGIHLGASGLITGYWALLVTDIYQQGTVTAILLGIISLYYFSGIFLGIFPGKKGVSWEGHFFGLIAGFATGYFLTVN